MMMMSSRKVSTVMFKQSAKDSDPDHDDQYV